MSSTLSSIRGPLGLRPEAASAIDRFSRRRRILLAVRGIAAGLLFLVAAALVITACDYLWLLSSPVRWLLGGFAYVGAAATAWWFGFRMFGASDPRQIARQIEVADPRLREDLISAVELADPSAANGSESFRSRLQDSIGRRTAMLDVRQMLPFELVKRWLVVCMIVAAVMSVLMFIPQIQFARRIARAILPGVSIERASLTELKILKPSPASGFVAQGDAVGVIVEVGGRRSSDITLHWRTSQGIGGESPMTPRVESSLDENTATAESSSDSVLATSWVFAANLPVGSDPIEYRITGGDAITLWHTLTPLPRPRVQSFSKRYVFPSYAKLDDRIEESEHGDLQALAGTSVKLTVRFDEPVQEPSLRFGPRGSSFAMQSFEGSSEVFQTSIPIRTPAEYQVDATSVRSGLSNPFSPQYTVTPIIDTPPTVRWTQAIPPTSIVSPLDEILLSAVAEDDLPIDRLVQEYQINGKTLIQRTVPVAQAGRELATEWSWDLMRRDDGVTESTKLASGDLVQTRLVAIDRLGQRGESAFVQWVVAEDGFEAGRHDSLERLAIVTEQVTNWAREMNSILDELREPTQRIDAAVINEKAAQLATLRRQTPDLLIAIAAVVAADASIADSGHHETIGRAISDLDSQSLQWADTVAFAVAEQHPSWESERQKTLKRLGDEARELAAQASRIDQLATHGFAQKMSLAVVADTMSLERSVGVMTGVDSSLPIDRFPRYLKVADARMKEITELISMHRRLLPDSTSRHFEQWETWSNQWADRLERVITDATSEDQIRSLVQQFETEVRGRHAHTLIDGRIASSMASLTRDIRNKIQPLADGLLEMKKHGERAIDSRKRADREDDSNDVARYARDAQLATRQFEWTRRRMVARLDEDQSLHRSRMNVDLQYAADLNLLGRAIENVSGQGFADYKDESAAVVHQNLSEAIRLIQADHEVEMAMREIRDLAAAERRLSSAPIAKVEHPLWIERYATVLEWPSGQLRSAGLDWSLVEPIDRARYNDDFNQSRSRITSRRWSSDEMVPADLSLNRLKSQLDSGLMGIEPDVVAARAVIARYVLSIPELARQAAEKAERAKQMIEDRPDESPETTERLAQDQQVADQAAEDVIRSLVDFANTSDVTDARQRELARDADAAAAQIDDAAKRADEAMKSANDALDPKKQAGAMQQTADALDNLNEVLERTADHFERAENGQDIAESREQLRRAEEALQIERQLQQRFDRAKAMAEAAKSSPEELMQKLEAELKTNEPMRKELSDIAQQSAQSAQRSLEQAAKDEAAINQSLERSDPAFRERKERVARDLQDVALRGLAVDQTLLRTADKAASVAETPEQIKELADTREALRDSVGRAISINPDQTPLAEMESIARELNRSLDDAGKQLDAISRAEAEASDREIHDNDSKRENVARQLERQERDARNQLSRSITQQRQQWSSAERAAGQRIQQAQRQKRDAERAKQDYEKRLAGEPNNEESIRRELEKVRARIDEAQRAEQSAKQSRELAKEKSAQATQRERELGRQRLELLKKANPGAELAQRLTKQASDQLKELREQLGEVADVADAQDQLSAPESQTESLARQQERVADDVADVSEQLERAARHEQRLGNDPAARELEQAAQQVADKAGTAAAQAQGSLEDASARPEQSSKANQDVRQAQSEIDSAAESLGQMIAQQTESQQTESQAADANPANSNDAGQAASQASPSQQRARQLAQTLDELDQSINGSPPKSDSDQPGENEQSGDQAAGDQVAGDQASGGKPSTGPPATAADASPTLAQAMENQAQNAARERQQQFGPPGTGQGEQAGPPGEPGNPSGDPAAEPGSGQMPGGGEISADGVTRDGDPWGQLRSQRTEDATESAASSVPPEYRREVEAYFRAIARQAAAKK